MEQNQHSATTSFVQYVSFILKQVITNSLTCILLCMRALTIMISVELTAIIEPVQIDNWFDFDTNPLYAIMHESIYCQVLKFDSLDTRIVQGLFATY